MGRPRRQAAAIAYRVVNARVEIAVITSTGNGEWILPKGGIRPAERPSDAAAREAEEEAGILGIVAPAALGQCRSTGRGGAVIHVYVLRAATVLDEWPEMHLRQRRWMSLADASVSLRLEFRPFTARLSEYLLSSSRVDTVRAPRLRLSSRTDQVRRVSSGRLGEAWTD